MSFFTYSSQFSSEKVSPTIVGCCVLAALVCIWLRRRSARVRFPPGPPPKFLVGNILDISPKAAWEKLTEYKDVYGDLVFFHGLGNHVLVLNSMQRIMDLLEKRASIYSERPIFTVASELIGLGQSIPMLPYNDELRAQRKLAHLALGPGAVRKYHGIQEDLAALLARHLLDTPEDFFSHVRHTASRIILAVTYGLSVKEAEDEYIAHAEETMAMIGAVTVPGAFLCDLWPWMKHLPKWLPFHRVATHGREMVERFISKPLEHVREQMKAGTAPQSLAHDLLLIHPDYSPAQEKRIRWTAGCLYGAGGETTYTTVLVFIAAMALYPDVQRRAQAELDSIVGLENLPRITDRERLPFVNAIIKETMRWHPAVPLSIARMTARQDEYEGFMIPKGTVVIPNVWAVAFAAHGPHDPTEFVPERFLGPNPPPDPVDWAFGFGKRLCPGQHLAHNSVFILVATILAAFDISPPDGQDIDLKYSPGLISYPLPFKCRITPRSEARAKQVLWRSAETFGL